MDDLYVVSFVVMFNLVDLLTVSTNQYSLLKLCNYDSKNLHHIYIVWKLVLILCLQYSYVIHYE